MVSSLLSFLPPVIRARGATVLTIHDSNQRFNRRAFLQIGGVALGGLEVPGLLRASEFARQLVTGKQRDFLFLPGGPTHGQRSYSTEAAAGGRARRAGAE